MYQLKASKQHFVVTKEDTETVDIRLLASRSNDICTVKKSDLTSASDWKPSLPESKVEEKKEEAEPDYSGLWFGI